MTEKKPDNWLPAGWTVVFRVRKTGKRDKYYIDPISKSAFRSAKEVEYFLKTGERPRRAVKPKCKGSENKELKNVETSPPDVAKKQTPEASRKRKEITGNYHITELNEMVKNMNIGDHAYAGEQAQKSGQDTDEWELSVDLSCLNLGEGKNTPDQPTAKHDFSEYSCISTSPTEALPYEVLSEDTILRHETKRFRVDTCGSKAKKVLSFPLRTSKRLAGLEPDLVPELKTNNRPRLVAKSRVERKSTADGCSSQKVLLKEQNRRDPCTDLPKPEMHAGKLKTEIEGKKHETEVFCHGDSPLPGQHSKYVRCDIKDDEKSGSKSEPPFGDFLKDPCIEFAIRTLTGSIDVSSCMDGSRGLNKSNHPCGNENTGPNQCLPLGKTSIDPCIEFAIKTLTGTIPVEYDQGVWSCLQHKHS